MWAITGDEKNMPWFRIPTKKEYAKNCKRDGVTMPYDDCYKDFICDVCKDHLKEGDAYIIISGAPFVVRHILCDDRYK